MTISTTSSSVTVAGDGLTSSFTFPFVADSADNIIVQYIDEDGIQTTLNPSQYTLVINPAGTNQLWGVGGSVTYPLVGSPIAAGTYLLIQRTLPLTQEVTVRNQGNYYAQVTEQALDILEMQVQQVSSRTGQLRGVWTTATNYNYGDIVQDGANGNNTGNYYTCAIANTSDVWADDLAAGYWSLGFNVQEVEQFADDAAASAAAALASQVAAASSASSASTSASTATTQAGIATTQAGIATTQASNAATSASQAANYAASYSGTSTTSLLIATGAKVFTTQASKLWVNGQFLQIASNADAANYMHGTVTSYSGTTLTMNITDIGGSGTFADWNISISGTQGPQGTPGVGSGTVTSVSVTSANGFAGSVATATTTPAITLSTSVTGVLKGNGTAISAAVSGTDYAPATSGSSFLKGNGSGGFSNQATIALSDLSTQSANTFVANATSGSAAPTAVALSASQLAGRGSSGDIAAITLGTNLSMSGTTLNSTAGVFTGSYTSTQQTITSGGSLTLPHGLGGVPVLLQCTLVCQTGELGYTAGDILFINPQVGYEANIGVSVVPDATNLNIRFGSDTSAFGIQDKGTGAGAGITNGNWKIVFRAYV